MTNDQKTEGIVILGLPRSGTTLLRRLLDAHPAIACPGETNLLASCARFLHTERGAEGLDVGVLSGLRLVGFERDEVLGRLREFAFGFHRDHARRQGKPRWAEKSAFDAFHVRSIETLCEDQVTYVCLLRHGLDVAASLQEFTEHSQGYLFELYDYVRRHARPLEAFARAWVDVTWELLELEARRPGQVVRVRYEDLVQQPEQELTRVLERIGEPYDPQMLTRGLQSEATGFGDWKTYARTSLDTGSIDRWRKLPRGIVGDLAAIANPMLERCGYDPVKARPRPTGDAALERYELGLKVQSMRDPDAS